MIRSLFRSLTLGASLVLAACSGGGGGSSAVPSQAFTPTPVPTAIVTQPPAVNQDASVVLSQTGESTTVGTNGTTATLTFPGASLGAGATLSVLSSATPPQGLPAVQSLVRMPKTATAVLYLQLAATQNLVLTGWPSFTSNAAIAGIAVLTPGAASWSYGTYAPGSGGTYAASGPFNLNAGQSYVFALYTGTPATPTPAPTATPTLGPVVVSGSTTFQAIGQQQTFTVSQSGAPSGTYFTVTTSAACAAAATVVASPPAGPPAPQPPAVAGTTFTVTALQNSTACSITFTSSANAASASIVLNVSAPLSGPGAPLTGPSFGPAPQGGWGPPAVASALQFPVQSGFNGSGITVAVVSASNVYTGDLTQYSAYFQIPQTGRTYGAEAIGGATVIQQGSDIQESTLDVETIEGLAPGANVLDYVIPSLTDASFIEGFDQIIADGKASVVSVSFGACEALTPASTLSSYHTVLQTGAQDGIAIVAASGDLGSACPTGISGLYYPGVQYPASDQNVIAVGGTESSFPANGLPQDSLTNAVVWDDTLTLSGKQEASGGGVSQAFAIPSFQVGLPGIASTQYRNVPDVAMPAVGASTILQGVDTLLNGTSWAAPQLAAMLAEVYQYCNVSRIPNASAIPYAAFQSAGYKAFIDVTSGNNHYNGLLSTPTYIATGGYSNATGIGVPLGMPVAQALCPNRVLSHNREPAVPDLSAARGSEAPFQADATPRNRDLVDRGRRSPIERTPVLVTLRPSASLAGDEQRVMGVLQAAGFTITRTFRNHLVVEATGGSGSVERFFATEMHDAGQGQYGTRYMPVKPITVPAQIAPYVAGVILNDVVTMTRRSR